MKLLHWIRLKVFPRFSQWEKSTSNKFIHRQVKVKAISPRLRIKLNRRRKKTPKNLRNWRYSINHFPLQNESESRKMISINVTLETFFFFFFVHCIHELYDENCIVLHTRKWRMHSAIRNRAQTRFSYSTHLETSRTWDGSWRVNRCTCTRMWWWHK